MDNNLYVKNIALLMEEYDNKLKLVNRENVMLTALCKELHAEIEKLNNEIKELKDKYEKPIETKELNNDDRPNKKEK